MRRSRRTLTASSASSFIAYSVLLTLGVAAVAVVAGIALTRADAGLVESSGVLGTSINGMLAYRHANGNNGQNNNPIWILRMVDPITGLFRSLDIQPLLAVIGYNAGRWGRGRTPRTITSTRDDSGVHGLFEYSLDTGVTKFFSIEPTSILGTSSVPIWSAADQRYYLMAKGVGNHQIYRIDTIVENSTFCGVTELTNLAVENGVTGSPFSGIIFGLESVGDYLVAIEQPGGSSGDQFFTVYNRSTGELLGLNTTIPPNIVFTGQNDPYVPSEDPTQQRFTSSTYDESLNRYYVMWVSRASSPLYRYIGHIDGTPEEIVQQLISNTFTFTLSQFPMSQTCSGIVLPR